MSLMSSGEQKIVCRRCNEVIPIESENCPECGASIRSNGVLISVIAIGCLVAGVSLFQPGELLLFGVVGLAVAATAGFILYNKRKRMREVIEDHQESGLTGLSDESN
jgi:uncharacterized membrane protein